MKCLFAYNPISGKGKAEKYRDYIVKRLTEKFGDVEVRATSAAGELEEIAASACGYADVLVFAGGDGSWNEVANGLGEREDRPVLGYIPTGTVNDIARSTAIPRKIKRAVDNIVAGTEREFDMLKINDRYAVYVVCCGGITACSYTAKQSAKKKLGKIAYALEVLESIPALEEFPLEFEGGGAHIKTSAVTVMIMNGISVAGLKVNSVSAMDDGKAEVVIVRGAPRDGESELIKHSRYFISSLKIFTRGYRKLMKDKEVFTCRGDRFVFGAPKEVIWNYDGEAGEHGNIEVRVLPRHIRLIVPQNR